MSHSTAPRRTMTTRIGPGSAGIPMTPEEFDTLPFEAWDDRYRYELIRGVLVVTPIAGGGEADPNEEFGYLLRSYRDHHPRGSALDRTLSERYVAGLKTNRRRADRVIWAGMGRFPDEAHEVPTIAVEFVSARRRDWLRDYEEKRDEYLAAGVREYWVVDRFRRTMTVYRRHPAGVAPLVIKDGETYQTELLPGLEVPLARLLATADRWSKGRRGRGKREAGGPIEKPCSIRMLNNPSSS